MRLHGSPTSPYVRKVRVLLVETGQTDLVEMVAASGTPLDASAMPLALNPLGKIPTLERDDGGALHDSRVICRYLAHRAGTALYPQPPRLWDSLTLEATADGLLDAAVAMVYEHRLRAPDKASPELIEAQWTRIARTVAALEARWTSHLAGPLDIGQIALGVALSYLDFRHPDREWRVGAPALAAWHARIAARPAMQQTAPPQA